MSGNGRWGGPGAGAPEARASSPLPEVRGFAILNRLGKGGMGEVCLARQHTLDRLVAIKFFSPEDDADPEHDPSRFRREAELMAKVSHPNVVSVYDFGEANGSPYLVMEYIEGGDLRRLMPPGQSLPPDQVLGIVLPVGEALAHLHRLGIVHRDLKPENVLLHNGGRPRVADFGIAALRAGAGALTRTGRGLGTLGYVAPEQQYRLKVDERADQYSLAALTYEMLTGQLPLGVFKSPTKLNARLRPELDAVLMRGLQESPNDRYPSIRDFTVALERALAPPPSSARRAARRRAAWLAMGVVAAAGATAVYVEWQAAARARPRGSAVAPRPTDTSNSRPVRPVAETAPTVLPALAEQLKSLRARRIWEARGSPTGPAGEAVKDEIWFEAEASVEQELKEIAYGIWEGRGRPTGPAGEAVKDEIWHEAERKLYKKLTEKGPAEPR